MIDARSIGKKDNVQMNLSVSRMFKEEFLIFAAKNNTKLSIIAEIAIKKFMEENKDLKK